MPAIIELVHSRQTGSITIFAIATCEIAGSQEPHPVAKVSQIDSPNPLIEWLDELTTLGMSEKVINYVRERPWE
jgi:hypothetical protein